jgi:RIO kinase 1
MTPDEQNVEHGTSRDADDQAGWDLDIAHAGRHERHEQLRQEQAASAERAHRFEPSVNCSRQEYAWIVQTLSGLYYDGVIADVLYRVKGGKEATVYCCRAGRTTGWDLVAAKVYRPSTHRTMRNDWLYRAGRETTDESGKAIRDGRSLRAIVNRSGYGKALLRGSWIAHEFAAMVRLHEAGVHLPRPLEAAGDTILMEFIGDLAGAAPTLHEMSVTAYQAASLWEQLAADVAAMLSCHVIHADLSAHNVLYDGRTGWLIDFPQAVDPMHNPRALELLVRDCQRLGQYFARAGLRADGTKLALDLWERYGHGEL